MDSVNNVEMSDATHNGPKRPFSIPNHVSPSRSFKAALMTPLSISTNIPPVVIKFTGVGGAPTAFNKLDFDEQTAIVAVLTLNKLLVTSSTRQLLRGATSLFSQKTLCKNNFFSR